MTMFPGSVRDGWGVVGRVEAHRVLDFPLMRLVFFGAVFMTIALPLVVLSVGSLIEGAIFWLAGVVFWGMFSFTAGVYRLRREGIVVFPDPPWRKNLGRVLGRSGPGE